MSKQDLRELITEIWLPEIDMAYTILSEIDTKENSPSDVETQISNAASRLGGIVSEMLDIRDKHS